MIMWLEVKGVSADRADRNDARTNKLFRIVLAIQTNTCVGSSPHT